MRNKFIKCFLGLFLFFVQLNNAFATEIIENINDGWYIVDSKTNMEQKEWVYYENGIEQLRLNKMVCAHRGWNTAPENSLASFQETANNGYYCIETDIRFTSDNVPVLLHDTSINRVASIINNGEVEELTETVNIADISYQELLDNYIFNVNRNVNNSAERGDILENYNDNRITSLEDALDWIIEYNNKNEHKMFFQLELKTLNNNQAKLLYNIIKRYNMDGVVLWSSFAPALLDRIKNESLGKENLVLINTSFLTSCDPVGTSKCKEYLIYDTNDKLYNYFKTENNFVRIGNYCGSDDDSCVKTNLPNVPVNLPDWIGNKKYLDRILFKRIFNDIMIGDMNNNNKIDLKDIIILIKKYLGTDASSELDISIGDMNNNNQLDLKDIILLIKTYLNVS